MIIPVGISARHIHLTKEDFIKLFGYDELTKYKDINQPGLYAANERVTIKGPKCSIEDVRIMGPFRSYSQVEISKTDSYFLGVSAKIRKSGVLDNTDSITVIGPNGEIEAPVIIANRHIHISKDEASMLGIKDNDKVYIKIKTEKAGIIEAYYKVSDEAYKELHLDLDDANAFLLNQGDEVEIVEIK